MVAIGSLTYDFFDRRQLLLAAYRGECPTGCERNPHEKRHDMKCAEGGSHFFSSLRDVSKDALYSPKALENRCSVCEISASSPSSMMGLRHSAVNCRSFRSIVAASCERVNLLVMPAL